MSQPPHALLEVQDLAVELRTERGWVEAIGGISFSVAPGRTLALVGESGCGKSVTAMSILRLLPDAVWRAPRGRILLRETDAAGDRNLLDLAGDHMREIRGRRIAMIFQEPAASLNPVMTIGEQIVEVLELHLGMGGQAAQARVRDLLDQVGLTGSRNWFAQYPHQLSGGMCQRAMMAMALAGGPSLLIADEPTTALDVKTQSQILNLLAELQNRLGMAILLITHDLGVVSRLAHEVCVMYAGRIVERGETAKLIRNPQHPYTRALLDCLPSRVEPGRLPTGIPGSVPPIHDYPRGCRFHPRCQRSMDRARAIDRNSVAIQGSGREMMVLRRCVEPSGDESGGVPPLREVSSGHWVACWECP